MLCILELTPTDANTHAIHPSLFGNVNLEVTLKAETDMNITVLIYAACWRNKYWKNLDMPMLSSDY